MQTMLAFWVISTPLILGLMHELIHGIILHRCMPFPPFAYLVSKSRNNAHGTLVFGLTNDAQSWMQILYETHLFLGLTCVIQALAKHSLKHTCLAHIVAYCDSALHKPFACLLSVVLPHSPTKHIAGGNLLKTKMQETRRANIMFFISSLQSASTSFLIDRKSLVFSWPLLLPSLQLLHSKASPRTLNVLQTRILVTGGGQKSK